MLSSERPRRRRTSRIAFSLAVILLGLSASRVQAADSWTTVLSATFKILSAPPEISVTCTGWFAAPLGRLAPTPVSVYVTAGHCPAPHIARTTDGLEQMAIVARITRPGMDAGVGLRRDPRPFRAFPDLAAAPPLTGDRALVAGYSDGQLIEAILTAIEPCTAEFICFHSDQALRPGMSGAPIVSLRTASVVGIVVASRRDGRGDDDPRTIMATPAARLRTLVDIAAPGTLHPVLPDASRGGLRPFGAVFLKSLPAL